MRNIGLKLFLTLLVSVLVYQNSSADTYPKREMRSAWVATVWNLDWPKDNSGADYQGTTATHRDNQKTYLRNMIQKLKDSGFNAVNFQVRSMCDAMYESSYEPWSVALTGKRGNAPYGNWDPLAYCVEVCHELGMECHAWVNPFRFCTSSTLHSTTNDMTLRNNGWIITYAAKDNEGNVTSTTSVLNPAIENVRNYIVESICKEIVQKYDIDGMVWDDYFYPNGIPTTSEAADYKQYQSYKNSGGTMSMGDWRRDNVNQTVKMAFDMIQREKAYVKFGIAPAGVANVGAKAHGIEPAKISSSGYQYNGIFADPCAWIIDGYIDYISPQLYWIRDHQSAPFDPLCEWWNNLAATYGVQCYISHDIASSTTKWNNSTEDYVERYNQIQQTRTTSVDYNPGQIYYSAGYINGPNTTGFGNYLKANTYQYNALPPKIVREDEVSKLVNPGKVANLTRSASEISWTAINNPANLRYAVYAIPLSVGVSDATSTLHTEDGGFKAEYLVDVTYNNSYTGVPTGSYWYAVTAIDRYGYEWEAATIDAPNLGDVTLSLNAPTSGTTLPFGDNTFSWTSDGTSFIFQISTSEDFNRPLIEQELSTKNFTLNITPEEFADGVTYYWRVVASKDNYNSAWSEVRDFTIETRPFIPLTLLNPQNNSTIDFDIITFEWEGIEGASYTIEIAEYPSFNTIIKTATTTNTYYMLTKSSFTGGKTYFWRIKATKDGHQPSTSDYQSFKTPKVEGEIVDGLTIEKLWVKLFDELPSELKNSNSARSIAAYGDNLYILERATGDTQCYLLEFSGKTCEFIKQTPLTGDIYSYSGGTINNWDHKAGQCIFTDDTGNLYISCLAVASELRPITVCSVDVSTGSTTKIFEADKTATRHRIDFANATGNLSVAGGQIWAATADNLVYRWTRNSNGTWVEESTTITEFYPQSETALGTACYIQPISSTQFIVDGADTYPTLYTFNSGSTAIINSSFADNAAIQPTTSNYNGTCSVTVGSTPLFVYVDDIHSFSIVANKQNFDFAEFQFMKSVPETKLGTAAHSWNLDQPVAVKNDDGSATIYVYAPKNGLAAYRVSLPEIELTLNAPADNEVFEEDFDFSWSGVDGASYTLELSTTESFDEIAFSATTEETSYNSSNFNLSSVTQYYWRVKASHPNYTSATSETRSFISPQKKSAKENLTIKELWNFSENKGNLPSQLNADNLRSMTAYNGNVYVTTTKSGALLKFNGSSGEYQKTINLSGDCFKNSSGSELGNPTNCVFVDGGNNLCVSNLVGSSYSTNPLTVCTIDVETGKTTRIFESTVSIRVDYANAYGDITKDGGQIWASTNTNQIYRWTRVNGSWKFESSTINSFYPTNATSLGTAPWIMPISETQFLVDGGGNYPTLYTFNAGGNSTYVSGFNSNTALTPRTIAAGGTGEITLGKYPLFIYNSENHQGAGHNFDIVHNPSSYDFSKMESLWTKIPDGKLGDTNHSYILNSVATIKNEDNSATVFLYAPKNGLAAYRISLPDMPISLNSPIKGETAEEAFDFKWSGISGSTYTIEVSTSETFDKVDFTATTNSSTYSSVNFALTGSTKYYWRVKAANDNYTTTTSAVAQFTTSALPELPITLNSPIDNVQTQSGFDFMWTGVDGASYTIELSETSAFDKITYSATTQNNIYSSYNFPSLPNSSTYYWRVTASHKDYSTTTSDIAQFITPAKPALCTPVLYMPYDNEELSSDIVFIAIKAYLVNVNSNKLEHADNSILEISRTADFSELIYSNDEWVDVQAGTSEYVCIQHTLPISYFTNGTYYWRVRAQESGYDDAVSAPLTFTVTGQSDTPGIAESDYTIEREDNPIYESITETSNNKTTTWQLTNLWIRNSEKNDIGQSATSTNYRGFCARSSQYGDQDGKDILWVAYHNGSATGSLEKYDAATGEYIGSLQLTEKNENLLKSTYPCNDVFVDGAGNLCVMNLKGNSNDLQIAAIDPETGLITHNVTLTVADHRIDHARAIGDITSGEGYVFGTDNNTTVYRWELYNGEVVDMHTNTVTSFYPSKYVSILGTATRIYPIDKTHFYTDGTATAFTLYTFSETGSNATLTSSFNSYDGTDVAPVSGNYGNGGTFFMHDGTPFIVYNNSSFASDKANVSYKFNLARVSELTSWGTITKFFGLPNDNIGTVVNAGNDYGMLADYLQYDALTGSPKGNIATFSNDESFDRTNIYLYVPGNGMAAYSLSRHIDIFTGADGIEVSGIKIGYNDEEITFGREVEEARVFTLSGMQIGAAENSTTIEKPAEKGVYILQLNVNGVTTTHKIVI